MINKRIRAAKEEIVEIFRNFKKNNADADWIEVTESDFNRQLMVPVLKAIAKLEAEE